MFFILCVLVVYEVALAQPIIALEVASAWAEKHVGALAGLSIGLLYLWLMSLEDREFDRATERLSMRRRNELD